MSAPSPAKPRRPRRRLGFKKKLLLLTLGVFGASLLLELGLRAIYAVRVGPSMLLYGTSFHREAVRPDPKNTAGSNIVLVAEGYSKYQPNQRLKTPHPDTGVGLPVTINSRGFRGRDFSATKAPGTIRVVTLGASSTFGFHNGDDETYPRQLQKLLAAEGDGREFEVINLGIPHMTSTNVLAVFLDVGLELEPDVVTLYTGHNDVHVLKDAPRRRAAWIPALHDLGASLSERLILVAKIHAFMKGTFAGFRAADLEPVPEASAKLIANIDRIHTECRTRGARFFAMTQQKRSMMIPREQLQGVTYREEAAKVREKLAATGLLTAREFGMLAHERFMADLVAWARARDVPLVDVVGAMNQARHNIVSPVHLSRDGNTIVARALADAILGSK